MAVPNLERREGVVFLLSWHITVWGFCVLVFAFFVCLIIGVHWGGLFLYSGGTG